MRKSATVRSNELGDSRAGQRGVGGIHNWIKIFEIAIQKPSSVFKFYAYVKWIYPFKVKTIFIPGIFSYQIKGPVQSMNYIFLSCCLA